jgi:proline iminopeptidase
VHGGPGLPHNYLLPALQPLGDHATLWFFDARGHGLSEHNRPNDPYTMEQLVDDVEGFAKAMGFPRYTVLGHSFGGMVALRLAARHPEGLDRLILSDTAPSAEYAAGLQETLRKVMPPGLYDRYESTQKDTSLTPDERLRRAMRIVYPFYWRNAPAGYYLDQDINTMNLNSRANEEIWASDAATYDVREQLAEITIPTLILVGRHDIVTPVEQARAIKDRMPNAQLVVLENSGHYPFYEENYLWTKWIYTFLTYYT